MGQVEGKKESMEIIEKFKKLGVIEKFEFIILKIQILSKIVYSLSLIINYLFYYFQLPCDFQIDVS